jgi:hypothetical protein
MQELRSYYLSQYAMNDPWMHCSQSPWPTLLVAQSLAPIYITILYSSTIDEDSPDLSMKLIVFNCKA